MTPVAQLQKTLAMDPNYFPTHHWLSMTYIQKSMPSEALQEARKAADLSNESTLSMSDLARSYAATGNANEARRILQALQTASKSRYISSFEVATIFASLNESDHAFDSLQRAYENRDYNLFRLRADPRLESLHNDPRFADLLRRIGLPQQAGREIGLQHFRIGVRRPVSSPTTPHARAGGSRPTSTPFSSVTEAVGVGIFPPRISLPIAGLTCFSFCLYTQRLTACE